MPRVVRTIFQDNPRRLMQRYANTLESCLFLVLLQLSVSLFRCYHINFQNYFRNCIMLSDRALSEMSSSMLENKLSVHLAFKVLHLSNRGTPIFFL